MPSYVTPKVNTQYIFYIGLVSQADTKLLQSNPTIASGDFKVSTDGGAFANLGTLPTVTPASGKSVKITLSTSEMNGDNIVVVCSDASGGEWCDQFINIQTSARQIDDLMYPTVSGRSTDVSTGGEVGMDWANIGSPTTSVNLSGTSTKAVEPTVAGRTLDVSTGGEAGLDWANIGSPTTTVNLSGTSTKSLQPTVAGRTLDVSATGEGGVDWANVGSQSTTVNLSATSIASSPATLSSSERNAVADALLTRDQTLVSPQPAVNDRVPLNAIRLLNCKWTVLANTLTVYEEDDTTVAWSATETVSSGASPIVGSDPA